VRLYFAPLLWLIIGVVVLASHAYTGSSRYRARVSSDSLAEVQKANSQRFMTVVVRGLTTDYRSRIYRPVGRGSRGVRRCRVGSRLGIPSASGAPLPERLNWPRSSQGSRSAMMWPGLVFLRKVGITPSR
jgi:hypothetical protein